MGIETVFDCLSAWKQARPLKSMDLKLIKQQESFTLIII